MSDAAVSELCTTLLWLPWDVLGAVLVLSVIKAVFE
jgi:hypothetical protein